jgi:hypothetical protein
MDKDALLDPESSEDREEYIQQITLSDARRHWRSGRAILACCMCTLLMGTAIGFISGRRGPSNSFWEPSSVLQDLTLSFTTPRYDGDFMHESIYRQPGRPEVDEAWEALGINCKSV